MLEIVETNAAAILTITILWSSITWMLTYWVMSQRHNRVVEDYEDVIDFLNIYCDELHVEINNLNRELTHIIEGV